VPLLSVVMPVVGPNPKTVDGVVELVDGVVNAGVVDDGVPVVEFDALALAG